jgi:hypothetical protein
MVLKLRLLRLVIGGIYVSGIVNLVHNFSWCMNWTFSLFMNMVTPQILGQSDYKKFVFAALILV